ncbi:MAG: PAS domain S-box protein, partial [Verrucomicrobia bacterium]
MTAGPKLRTLIIEDSEFDALMLATHLEEAGYQVHWERVETAEAMRAALDREEWDVIFSDHQMPAFSADEALAVLKETGRDIPFIIVSGGIGEDKAVDLMKSGAHDFVFKGQLVRLLPAVEREMREARTRAAHREARRQLEESERRLRLLWERSPDAILMMDEEGRVAFVNPAAEQVFGWSATEFVTLDARQLLQDPRASGEALPWQGLSEEAGAVMREFIGRRRDGTPLILEAGFSHHEFEGRRWVVAFIRDITERRRAEEALAERNREVA